MLAAVPCALVERLFLAPAVGYMSVHQKQQQDLVNDALNVD
jgi:2-oxoglutarate dehydrogenase complex dehydrogenase (E1) component-like enzyme